MLKLMMTGSRNLATLTKSFNKFAFYDLVLRTPSHPKHPLGSSFLSASDLVKLERKIGSTYEGNYESDSLSKEERIAKIFGGRIKGEMESSSRRLRQEPRVIAGITVPARPLEPDNCCMSGCINCVWEMYNDDIQDWKEKRIEAAGQLVKKGGVWPVDFHPPIKYLKAENVPKEMSSHDKHDSEGWTEVPVAIKVFAEFEKSLKAKRLKLKASTFKKGGKKLAQNATA